MRTFDRDIRKPLALALAALLLLSGAALPAQAAGGPTVTAGSADAAPGDTVTLPVRVSGNTGLTNFDLEVSAAAGLTLTGFSTADCLCEGGMAVSNISQGRISWARSTDLTAVEGVLFELILAVDAAAAPGTYAVSIAVAEGGAFSNEAGELEPVFVAGTVTVAGGAPSAGTPSGGTSSGGTPSGGGTSGGTSSGGTSSGGAPSGGTPSGDAPSAGAPSGGAAESAFPDVAAGAWYSRCVADMTARGVVKGYEDGTFRPNNDTTRGEALKLILLASGILLNDSKTGHWAQNYYEFALELELVEEGAALDAPIPRAEIANVIAGVNDVAASGGQSPFSDTDDGVVTALYEIGLFKGYDTGAFSPDKPLSRAELTMIVWRLYGYVATGTVPEN